MTDFTVIGGAHIDRRGKTNARPVMGASNPGKFTQDYGGAAFNAARTLAALGGRVSFLRPTSRDQSSIDVGLALSKIGLKEVQVHTDSELPTPHYTAILDPDGELIISLADMSLYDAITPENIDASGAVKHLSDSDAVLIDANLPAQSLAHIAAICDQADTPLFGIGTSPSKVVRFMSLSSSLALLFLNRREAEALLNLKVNDEKAETLLLRLRALGFKSIILTDGPNPVLAFDENSSFKIAPPVLDKAADVTGAGDALAAATMQAKTLGLPLLECMRRGIAASQITLASDRSVGQNFTGPAFEAALAGVPDADLLSPPPS